MTDQRKGAPSLRIGLLMDSYIIPAWVHRMLEQLVDSSHSQIALIVLNDAPAVPRRGFAGRVLSNWSTLLYLAYRKLDRRLFNDGPDPFAEMDASELLQGIPVIRARPVRARYSDELTDADVDRIRGFGLDACVRLGFRILKGRVLACAPFGVWSFHHGDNQVNRGGPAGFWEVFLRQAATGSMLQILNEDLDNGLVLARTWSATDPVSVHRSCRNFYWKTLALLPRQLEALHRDGPERFWERVKALNAHPPFYAARLYKAPGNLEFLRLLVRHMARYGRLRLDRLLYRDQWLLLYQRGPALGLSFWRFKKLLPPSDRFWADPHVHHRDGRHYVFIEEFLYAQEKGRIGVIALDESGAAPSSQPVLERPYHLSNPFVFRCGEELYLIPESMERRTLELYRCVRFPDQWELVKVLMENVRAADATPFYRDGRWWLFVNIQEQEGASTSDELFLFSAPHPATTEWRPHPMNPIVSDVRRARPAGRLFETNGNLYRPAQDCSGNYGSRIVINHVVRLSETEYEERPVEVLGPGWDPRLTGFHTLDCENGLTAADVRRRQNRMTFS
jgi:hypothetical protein